MVCYIGLGDRDGHQGGVQPAAPAAAAAGDARGGVEQQPADAAQRHRAAAPRALQLPLRRVRSGRRRPLQVQRPRVQVLVLEQGRRPAGVRLQTQHGRARLREVQTVPLRPTMGQGHPQGRQRVQG